MINTEKNSDKFKKSNYEENIIETEILEEKKDQSSPFLSLNSFHV